VNVAYLDNMTPNENLPKTLIEAVTYFADAKTCMEYMKNLHWPDGNITCPRCWSSHVKTIGGKRPMWKCYGCEKRFGPKVGTIFEKSPLSLSKWLLTVWLISNAKNGVSSCEISRSIGVCQKTAWFMLHRIREAMRNGSFKKLTGIVEADETFIGGKDKNRHANKKRHIQGHGDTTIVLGMIERGGRVVATVVDSVGAIDLNPAIRKHVEEGSVLYTDSLNSYKSLDKSYKHGSVNHNKGEYVRGEISTNKIENYWSLFKRTVKGTYIHVAPFHLDRYLDEQGFRYVERKGTDGTRFQQLSGQLLGRRLTWKELTGKATD
jgi:transposase-like protein